MLKNLLVIVTIFFHSTLAFSASSQGCSDNMYNLKRFIQENVKVTGCSWDINLVLNSLDVGLTRLCEINPDLVNGILLKRTYIPLEFICDVTEGQRYPYFSEEESTIHLWNTTQPLIRIQATLFHEFLHYTGIPYDPDVHAGSARLEYDPVYACHVSAYPEVAERILGSSDKLSEARKTCSEKVKFCDDGLEICANY